MCPTFPNRGYREPLGKQSTMGTPEGSRTTFSEFFQGMPVTLIIVIITLRMIIMIISVDPQIMQRLEAPTLRAVENLP